MYLAWKHASAYVPLINEIFKKHCLLTSYVLSQKHFCYLKKHCVLIKETLFVQDAQFGAEIV